MGATRTCGQQLSFLRVGVQAGARAAVQASRSGWGLCGTHWGQSHNRDLSVEGLRLGLWFVEAGTPPHVGLCLHARPPRTCALTGL